MWKADLLAKNVVEINIPFRTTPEWECWGLLQSDEHWDSPYCRRDILKDHLNEAVERDAFILTFGDSFDVMGGKYDKRASKDGLRPELKVDNYLDEVVHQYAEWHEPYARNIVMKGKGNHCTAVLRHWETDLMERTIALLNRVPGARVLSGGYAGFVLFSFRYQAKNSSGMGRRVTLYFNHGTSAGGPVTGGAIENFRGPFTSQTPTSS